MTTTSSFKKCFSINGFRRTLGLLMVIGVAKLLSHYSHGHSLGAMRNSFVALCVVLFAVWLVWIMIRKHSPKMTILAILFGLSGTFWVPWVFKNLLGLFDIVGILWVLPTLAVGLYLTLRGSLTPRRYQTNMKWQAKITKHPILLGWLR